MAPNTGKEKTILIVDDSPESIATLAELLSEYNTKVATNGEKALTILRAEIPIDLLLLDVMMPGMDGFELARIVKADPHRSGTPIIFITAKTDVQSFIQGFDLGADEYITKPFESESVLRYVRQRLG